MFYQPELDRGAVGGVGAMIDAQVSVYVYLLLVDVYENFMGAAGLCWLFCTI